MRIDVLTLFPGMFHGPLTESIIKRAREKGLLEVNTVNIRDYTTDKHHIADDYPFGGGAGMVMKPEPIFRAVDDLITKSGRPEKIILLCPQGRPLTQALVRELAQEKHLVLICGHYEGIDERVREYLVTDEISLGDFILTGGELPAMVLIDAVSRLIPGVLGEAESAEDESFEQGLLEYPQYTRPREFRGMGVPEILLSGDHEKIRQWRRQQSLLRTLQRRPDLLKEEDLTSADRELLKKEIT
ncbi:MAG: tRNA (guanosine(37)-N1)-methyltransferase TrmD [Clostridia bacterium]|nr:tRNA (guanosine(37)-N1)-methyltransferase TrmD [Clostridia bacterium]